MTITTFKLSTGEEIIGELDTDTEFDLIVNEPMLVDYFYDPNQGLGMKLSPYVPTIKDRLFTLYKKHVILYSRTEDASRQYYLKCIERKTASYFEDPSLLTEESTILDKKKLN